MKKVTALRACLMVAVAAAGGSWGGEAVAPKAAPAPSVTNRPATDGVELLLKQAYDKIEEAKWADALNLLERARKLAPENEVVRFGLGTVYIKLDMFKEAQGLLEALCKEFPDNPALKNNLAWVYAKSKDPAIRNPEKAIRLAQDAMLGAPGDFNVWGTLAEGYYQAGRYDRAVRVAAAALNMSRAAQDPSTPEFEELYRRCQRAAGGGVEEDTREKSAP